MTDVFHKYDEQYCELLADLTTKCSSAFALKGEQKKQMLSELTSGLTNAETLIKKMDLTTDIIPPKTKSILLEKLRKSKSNLKILKSEIKIITFGNLKAATRDEIRKADMMESIANSADQRSRLMKSMEGLVQANEKIKESQRKMMETEKIGVSILQELKDQRESLQSTQIMLHGVDDNVRESRSILVAMKIREFLVVAGPIIIYFLFKLVK